jgi:hypothetical protein
LKRWREEGLKKAVDAADITHVPLHELWRLDTADVRPRNENTRATVAGS